jgi:hypothetical protein
MKAHQIVFRPRLLDHVNRLIGLAFATIIFAIGVLLVLFSGYHALSLCFFFFGGLMSYVLARNLFSRVVLANDWLNYRATPFFPGFFLIHWEEVESWSVHRADETDEIPYVRFKTCKLGSNYIFEPEVSNPGFDRFVSDVNERIPELRTGKLGNLKNA